MKLKIEKTSTKSYLIGLIIYLTALFSQIFNLGLSDLTINLIYLSTTILSGYHIVFEGIEDTIKDSKEQKHFVPNIHLLMSLGCLGAVIIGNFEEAALLVLIFAGAHFLEEYTEGKSQREIKSLLEMNPSKARRILANGTVEDINVDQIKIGDTLQVQNGAQIAIDGVILSGNAVIDESAINGESIPREKSTGDDVFAGTINGNSTFTMKATKSSDDTLFAKILKLVNQSQTNLSKTATKIKEIEPKYVTFVLLLFPVVFLAGIFIFKWSMNVTIYRSIVFLISASPCALAASSVSATLSAISNLAKKGVLFKGGSFLSNISYLKTIAFDKTGTLTKGTPQVTDFETLSEVDENELAFIIFNIEKQTNHPLAKAMVHKFNYAKSFDLEVETIMGKGVGANYNNTTYFIGKPDLFNSVDIALKTKAEMLAKNGKTVVFISKDEVVVGLIALMDTPNEYSKTAISFFKKEGVHTVMITGDSKETGEAVGKLIGIDEIVTNVLPEDKANIIEKQKVNNKLVAMVGDGVNDTPALVTADVGVAMGEGTDVAIDVADVVLMKNDLSKFVDSYKISKKLNRIVWQNISLSMLVVIVLVVANFFGLTNIGMGVLIHEGSTLVVILNGLRLLSSKNITN